MRAILLPLPSITVQQDSWAPVTTMLVWRPEAAQLVIAVPIRAWIPRRRAMEREVPVLGVQRPCPHLSMYLRRSHVIAVTRRQSLQVTRLGQVRAAGMARLARWGGLRQVPAPMQAVTGQADQARVFLPTTYLSAVLPVIKVVVTPMRRQGQLADLLAGNWYTRWLPPRAATLATMVHIPLLERLALCRR